jgi:hypothetical protein
MSPTFAGLKSKPTEKSVSKQSASVYVTPCSPSKITHFRLVFFRRKAHTSCWFLPSKITHFTLVFFLRRSPTSRWFLSSKITHFRLVFSVENHPLQVGIFRRKSPTSRWYFSVENHPLRVGFFRRISPTSCWFLPYFIFRPWRRQHFSPLPLNRLHGLISQMITFLITIVGPAV